jgi:hypothetical protein
VKGWDVLHGVPNGGLRACGHIVNPKTPLKQKGSIMDTPSIEDIENSVLADDVSDEALEIAAGSGSQVTLAACTGVWSTFCPAG